jgi:5' nucleotidase family
MKLAAGLLRMHAGAHRASSVAGCSNRVPLHLAARGRRFWHADVSTQIQDQINLAASDETLALLAHKEALNNPDVQAVLCEWRQRSDAINEGQSDLLSKMLATRRSDKKELFVQNDVYLSEIESHGFDFDFTVVNYQSALHELIYSSALKILVEKR